MKPARFAVLVFFLLTVAFAGGPAVAAQQNGAAQYVVKKGDTLWGLSDRFMKDPYYWPDLWATNPDTVKNPHFIFPGQKLLIYPDRIEVAPIPRATPAAPAPAPVETAETPKSTPPPQPVAEEKPVEERTFSVSGGEGFIANSDFKPVGFVIAGQHGRQIYAQDDVIYTDIGTSHGGKAGSRFSVYKRYGAISHPLTNQILGYRVEPLGTIQLTEMAKKSSKGLVIESFQEIEPGAALLPYTQRKREIPLKAPDVDLNGYIVETKTGNQAISAGDVAYIDLGKRQGVKPGNVFYVVRKVKVEINYFSASDYDLPVDVLGALLVVDTAEDTATVLVIKSIDTIYKGDRIEMKKGR